MLNNGSPLYADLDQVLLTRDQIARRIEELGEAITRDYRGKDLVCVCILKGAAPFFSDLIRCIDAPLAFDFMSISSYGSSTKSSGVVRILKDLDRDIVGRDVLIVEDIIDSGMTLAYLKQALSARRPASLRICTLLDKPPRRRTPLKADYVGFVIEDFFVVGYGLDYAEKYRNLPDIGVLRPEIYG